MTQPLHLVHWPKDLPQHLDLPQTSLVYNLEVSATRYPDKTALIFYDAMLDYRSLYAQVETLAGWLQQACGVRRGDRVMLFMQNSPQFVIGYYAILRADAMVVPVNPMLKTTELQHYAADSCARVALCAQETWPQMQPLLETGEIDNVLVTAYSQYLPASTDLAVPEFVSAPLSVQARSKLTLWQDALDAGHRPTAHLSGPDDRAVMPYTSGTTGRPKGCIHTHRSVMHTALSMALWGGATTQTVMLGVVPLFHVTGMQGCMNSIVYLGATTVLMPRWDRQVAASMIERYSVNAWINVPTMVVDLLALPELDRYDLSSMRRVSGGGAAMPEAVATKMQALWGVDYVEGYGLSETIAPSHTNPPDRAKKQCLGVPIFDTECAIVDPETLKEVAQGEIGEIITRGPQVFQGYWNDDAKTAEAFINFNGQRYFRTGDLARMDADGYYFLVDRLKRMINAAGFKVWPAEVESTLYKHPGVQEACVIAAHDDYRGETVKAVIVPTAQARGSLTAEAVIAWSRDNMAAYKAPRQVEFVDALPKSGTGKIMWRLLQEQEAAR